MELSVFYQLPLKWWPNSKFNNTPPLPIVPTPTKKKSLLKQIYRAAAYHLVTLATTFYCQCPKVIVIPLHKYVPQWPIDKFLKVFWGQVSYKIIRRSLLFYQWHPRGCNQPLQNCILLRIIITRNVGGTPIYVLGIDQVRGLITISGKRYPTHVLYCRIFSSLFWNEGRIIDRHPDLKT